MATIDGVEAKLLVDNRVNFDEKPRYMIEKPADYIRYYQDISSSYSNTSISFSVVPPSPKICVDKKVYIDMQVDFTFTGTVPVAGGRLFEIANGDTTVMKASNDGLRWYPLAQTTNSLSVTLNNSTISQNLSDYIEPLARYGQNHELRRGEFSVGPSMHDAFHSYNDYLTYGSARNPLAGYGEVSSEQSRGAFKYNIIAGNGKDETTATIRVAWSEAIMLSPFLFQKLDQKAFIGLTNIDWVFSLGSLQHMWSHNPGPGLSVITNIAANISANPKLRFTYITPSAAFGKNEIDKVQKYPFYDIQRYVTNIAPVAASGTSGTISSNNVQLHSIPNKVYVVIKPSKTFKNDTGPGGGANSNRWELADTYATIDGVEVNWDNKNALLGSASSYDLYNLSVRNGLDMSWMGWSRFCGSVLCIDFSRDIGLNADQAVGMLGQFQLQIKVDYTNHADTDRQYEFYMVTVTEGIFTLADTYAKRDIGLVNAKALVDAANAGKLERITYDQTLQFDGGNFFSSLKKVASKVRPAIRAVGRVGHAALENLPKLEQLAHMAEQMGPEAVHKIAPYVRKYGPTIARLAATAVPLMLAAGYDDSQMMDSLVGLGYEDDDCQLAITAAKEMGSGQSGSGLVGSGLTGGRKASKSKLKSRA